MKKELSGILSFVEKLNSVDTSSVEPLSQVTGIVNAVRNDEPQNEFPPSEKLTELLIGQAPDRKDRFVKVKSVMKSK